MRGTPERQLSMLSSLSTEDLIPADHPIRRIRVVVDEVLAGLDGEFDVMYAASGRRSVPPETLLKATVLMAMYSIRSERAFCERLNYDMLFKWFLDMAIDDRAFDATTFTKNRQRLLDHEIADVFFAAVVAQAKLRRGRRSDLMAETCEFAVDAAVAPSRVLGGEAEDESADLVRGWWPSWPSGGLCPVTGDAAPIPSEQSVGCDDPAC